MNKMKVMVALTVLLISSGAGAQSPATDQSGTDTDIALLRSDVQAQKTDVIAHTMQLNDTDSKKFWPIYREYANQQQIIGDQRVSVLKEYSNLDTIDNAKADDLMGRMLKFDRARSDLRAQYYTKLKQAIGAKQAVKFMQVDNRLTLLVDLQLASAVPIIQ